MSRDRLEFWFLLALAPLIGVTAAAFIASAVCLLQGASA